MDVGADLDLIKLFGLLLQLSYVTFAIAFLMSLLVVVLCWQLSHLTFLGFNQDTYIDSVGAPTAFCRRALSTVVFLFTLYFVCFFER